MLEFHENLWYQVSQIYFLGIDRSITLANFIVTSRTIYVNIAARRYYLNCSEIPSIRYNDVRVTGRREINWKRRRNPIVD